MEPVEIDFSQPHMGLEDVREILKFGHHCPIYEPSERSLLFYQRAFVHRSVQEEIKRCDYPTPKYLEESNEVMETEGDSLFSAAVTLYLCRLYHDKSEGDISRMRSRIVQGKTMAKVADEKMNLGKYILTAGSVTGAHKNTKFLEDCFEAFVCAVYNDRGFDGVCKFTFSVITNCISEDTILKNTNYKDILIHFAKAFDVPDPEFVCELNDKTFSVSVLLGGESYGPATATRKRSAEQAASKIAVEFLGITEDLITLKRMSKKNSSRSITPS